MDENIDILYLKTPISKNSPEKSLNDINLDFKGIDDINYKEIQVFNTNTNNENITNPSLDKLIPTLNNLTSKKTSIEEIKVFNIQTNNNYTTNFILDCIATRYIIINKDFFISFK